MQSLSAVLHAADGDYMDRADLRVCLYLIIHSERSPVLEDTLLF